MRADCGRLESGSSICAISRSTWAGALRRDLAVLGHMPSKAVDELRALSHQHVPSAEHDCQRLLLLALHRHKPHRRTLRRLADRLRVSRIVLLPLDEGLDVGRSNQPHLVAELLQLSSPVMGAGASFHRHHAYRLGAEKREHLVSPKLLAKRDGSLRRRAMGLEHRLGQIQPDRANFGHGRLLRGDQGENTYCLTPRCSPTDGACLTDLLPVC